METIEITTTQNVVIQYPLATLGNRIIAYAVDVLVMALFILICSLTLTSVFESDLIFYFVSVPVFVFYTLAFENFMQGQTPGKRMLTIKVIRIDGDEPTLENLVTRWGFRMIDIYLSMGALASFLVHSTENKQRLGDIVSGTAVVKLRPDHKIELNDLLQLNKKEDLEFEYPEVSQFSEQQMITIKIALDQYKRHPNEAHRQAVNELYLAVCNRMNLPAELKKLDQKISFLRLLLSEYVALTR